MFEKKEILILDDDEAVRLSFIDYFEDAGWNVFSSTSAEEALTILKNTSPAAAVVDIRLPGIDGNEFIRKASLEKNNMVFVICTGSPQYQISADIVEIETVYKKVFTKPVTDLSRLEEAVQFQIDKYLN